MENPLSPELVSHIAPYHSPGDYDDKRYRLLMKGMQKNSIVVLSCRCTTMARPLPALTSHLVAHIRQKPPTNTVTRPACMKPKALLASDLTGVWDGRFYAVGHPQRPYSAGPNVLDDENYDEEAADDDDYDDEVEGEDDFIDETDDHANVNAFASPAFSPPPGTTFSIPPYANPGNYTGVML